MFENEKTKKALFITILIIIFGISYYITMSKLKNREMDLNKRLVNTEENIDKMTIQTSTDETISKNSKLVFKIKYKKSGECIKQKEEKANKFAGKTKKELEDFYEKSGYEVNEVTKKEVILVKEVDKYSPNKYVLGIKDGHIAIYKTDKNGDMYIENPEDITDIGINNLKEEDINLLINGDKYFQCNKKEDVEAILGDYE
ncbi:hypothetical protein CLOACE_18750 [Clostridium acetireducens DSM 10703]|jgi:hypothetical protein|uniref:Bypass of forespore C C-terminal domain-containing protein n=1 Tax=Clostridium acetireducens DSM 10703 TaxID=1121290 RepID=A0A1E8EWU7_9CLOT|nr:hypothetical protein [Clostridium acetireducens]OFI05257.1 hypothetical protein CLOACE_18750 [Clostridium acetireducens DSM 10703]